MTRFTDRRSPAGPTVDLLELQLHVERFEPLGRRRSPGVLGLSLELPFELPADAQPTLLLGREALEHVVTPRVASSCRLPHPATSERAWLWRGVFAAPPQLATDPCTWFALQVYDEQVLALPAPRGHAPAIEAAARSWRAARTWPYGLKRVALVLVVTCQFTIMPAFSAGGALADGTVAPASEGAPEETPSPPAGATGEAPPEAGGTTEPAAEPGGAPEPKPEPPHKNPTPPPSPTPGTGGGATEPPAEVPAGTSTEGSSPPPTHAGSPSESSPQAPSAAPVGSSATPSVSTPAAVGVPGPGGAFRGRRAKRVPTPSVALVLPQPGSSKPGRRPSRNSSVASRTSERDENAAREALAIYAPGEVSPLLSWLPSGLAGLEANEPPPYLIPIYEAAGRRYDVPWRVLAAINEIETNYGQNLSVSSAGALGWMQFMPATWQEWAVDADHDGQLNPYSPQDAIFTAARYLQASGAAVDLRGAIFAYNHADWYVTEVLLRAKLLGDVTTFAHVERGYSLPLDSRYMRQLGRTDDGVDIETAPDGALVYSMTPGIVSAVASDPGGFGPNYPVIEATAGALTGQHIYYGHVAAALVQPGQHVAAGQPIAIMGHTGDAASLGHGHIEIGFSDAGGDPLNHHGAGAWTPTGDVMRSLIVAVSSAFGVHNS
jgi:murein DD-endopeptidase MepM/ murein hydrolase activator NlpD